MGGLTRRIKIIDIRRHLNLSNVVVHVTMHRRVQLCLLKEEVFGAGGVFGPDKIARQGGEFGK